MRYPEFLKIGDTIGICAPSGGITDMYKIKRLEMAKLVLEDMGYNILETENVKGEEKGRSSSAQQRAKEFMELWKSEEVSLIITATGGDFLVEMLDYLDFGELMSLKPKWLQGYSDISGLGFILNTVLGIASMHSQSVKDYAMKPLHKSLVDTFEILKGNSVIQNSFDLYEKNWNEKTDDLSIGYNLTEKVEWKNLNNESKIKFRGRSIGGCLDVIKSFFGTKYDNINNYIDEYKHDGILWFLECFEMNTSEVFRTLWQMKQSGYFRNCTGIIFGRPLMIREDYNIKFHEAVYDATKELNIPIIYDADIGHVSPQVAIVNGAILEITSEKGKGIIQTAFR